MVYTAAQQTAFFTSAAQMGLSDRTRDQLVIEGITDVADLSEWTDDRWDDFTTNCRRPGQIPDPANAANLIHQQPFVVPVRSLKRLKIASKMVRYYEQTDRALSAANMQWTTVILNFDMQDLDLECRDHDASSERQTRRIPCQWNDLKHQNYSELKHRSPSKRSLLLISRPLLRRVALANRSSRQIHRHTARIRLTSRAHSDQWRCRGQASKGSPAGNFCVIHEFDLSSRS